MSSAEEQYQKERRHQQHAQNLSRQGDNGQTAQILHALSDIDDLSFDAGNDPVMGQLISRLTSTTNLSSEQVRSYEWVREYIYLLYLQQFPRPEGCHGVWRGYVHGDVDEERDPLPAHKRVEIETFVSSSKMALARSEDAKVIEESTRNIHESVVNDNDTANSGGGILGKVGLK